MPPPHPSLATILRVTPPPSTLSESRAILQYVQRHHGKVTCFRRAPYADSQSSTSPPPDNNTPVSEIAPEPRSATTTQFYTVFARRPVDIPKTSDVSAFTHDRTSAQTSKSLGFNVSVHDKVPDPNVLDPFNVRNLRERKPFPAPKIFSCHLELVDEAEGGRILEQLSSPAVPRSTSHEGRKTVESVMTQTYMQLGLNKTFATGLAHSQVENGTDLQRKQTQERENNHNYDGRSEMMREVDRAIATSTAFNPSTTRESNTQMDTNAKTAVVQNESGPRTHLSTERRERQGEAEQEAETARRAKPKPKAKVRMDSLLAVV